MDPTSPYLLVAAQPDPGVRKEDILETHPELVAAETAFRQAEEKYKSSNNKTDPGVLMPYLKSKMAFMSWSLLVAEQLVRADLDRYVTAATHFEPGLRLLDELEDDLTESNVKYFLDNDPTILVQYDAIKFRKKFILTAYSQNDSSIKDRVGGIQEVARAYRLISDNVLLAHRDYCLNNADSLNLRFEESLAGVNNIERILTAHQGDNYFLDLEPDLPTFDDADPKQLPAFSKGFLAQLHVLKALSVFSSASSVESNDRKQRLLSAFQSAEHGIAAPGGDQNPVAYFVKAAAAESIGLETVRSSPADLAARAESQQHFQVARESLTRARQLLDAGPVVNAFPAAPGVLLASSPWAAQFLFVSNYSLLPDPPLQALGSEIDAKLKRLGDPTACLTEARQHLADPTRGSEILLDAIKKHATKPLWLEYVRFGLRTNEDPSQLKNLLDLAIAPPGSPAPRIFGTEDYEPLILRAATILAIGRRQMARDEKLLHFGQVDIPDNEVQTTLAKRRELRDKLKEALDDLARAKTLIPTTASRFLAHCKAYEALTLALQRMLNDDPAFEFSTGIGESFALAKDARRSLTSSSGKPPFNSPEQIADAEALSAALYAHGFLSLMDDSQSAAATSEAMLAFAAAIDVQTSLPYDRSGAKPIGSPLIQLLLSQPGNPGGFAAQREQIARQAMEYFVDGSFAMTLGNPSTAVNSMSQGISVLDRQVSPTSDTPPLVDALALLSTESQRSVRYLPELLASYRILMRLEDAEFEKDRVSLTGDEAVAYRTSIGTALAEAIKLALPNIPDAEANQADLATLRRAVRNIPSPMVGFMLGRCLEGRVVALDLDPSPERSELMELARESLRVTDRLLDEESRARFPLFVGLRDDAYQRLSRPEQFLEKSKTFRTQLQIEAAKRVTRAGLRRHPTSNALWEELIDLGLVEADLLVDRDAKRASLTSLLTFVGYWEQYVGARDWDKLLNTAKIHEQLENWDEAMSLLTQAQQQASNASPQFNASVLARIARIRARKASAL